MEFQFVGATRIIMIMYMSIPIVRGQSLADGHLQNNLLTLHY